jgi:hypothetical protein
MTNILDMMSNMGPQMQNMGQVIGVGTAKMVQLVAELVRLTAPASGYDVRSGTTTDSFNDNAFRFSVSPRTIDLTIEDNDAVVQLSYDAAVYQKEFYIKAGVIYSISIACQGMQIKSRVNGAQARYQAMVQQ